MAGNSDIKGRIKGINSIKQITKAMKLVSVSKLKKAKEKAVKTQNYFSSLKEIIVSASSGLIDENKYINIKTVPKTALYIVVTADRGMCGGYNTNMAKEVIRHINEKAFEKSTVILIGTKGKQVFSKAGIEVTEIIDSVTESPDYQIARLIADKARESFDTGKVDSVYVGFTKFKSAIQQIPTVEQLLPLTVNKQINSGKHFEVDFDPSVTEVLEWALKKYLANMVFEGMIQASASQQGARMTAMDSATDNATEIIDKLTLTYNRARQAHITQEISEIVGGAEAIK